MWPPSLSQQYPKFKKNKMTCLETCEVTALGSREKGGNEQACSCVQSVVCLYVMFICGVHICLYEVCACVCVIRIHGGHVRGLCVCT